MSLIDDVVAEIERDAFVIPELLKLGQAVFDAISRKSAASVVNAETVGIEAAADIAEARKVGR